MIHGPWPNQILNICLHHVHAFKAFIRLAYKKPDEINRHMLTKRVKGSILQVLIYVSHTYNEIFITVKPNSKHFISF